MSYYAKRFFGKRGIVTDGLKLWLDASNPASYPGTGTTWFDLSGNNNNGTMVNGVVPLSNAMQFDGVNDYVNIPNSNSFNVGNNLSFSCWVNVNNVSTYRNAIFCTSTDNSEGTFILEIGTYNYLGGYTNGVSISTPGVFSFTVNNVIAPSLWYYITFTRNGTDAGSLKIYINGNEKNLNNNLGTLFSDKTTNKSIGARLLPSLSSVTKGYINDTMLYNRALTAEEVDINFQATRNKYGI